MDDKTQKRVQTVLAIVIAMVLSRPVNNFIDEQIPERRGAKDDLLEAVLQGAVRMPAFFAASLLVRKLAEMRRYPPAQRRQASRSSAGPGLRSSRTGSAAVRQGQPWPGPWACYDPIPAAWPLGDGDANRHLGRVVVINIPPPLEGDPVGVARVQRPRVE